MFSKYGELGEILKLNRSGSHGIACMCEAITFRWWYKILTHFMVVLKISALNYFFA